MHVVYCVYNILYCLLWCEYSPGKGGRSRIFVSLRIYCSYFKCMLLSCSQIAITNYAGAELVNQNLTACLDFNPNYTSPNPVVCHHIKQGEIPLANDSVVDAGFFVVSDKLNASNANICVQVGYHNMYSCNGIEGFDPYSVSYPKLFYEMRNGIYNLARAYDYCIHDHPEDDLLWCVRQVT
jgi:hypothetical protein